MNVSLALFTVLCFVVNAQQSIDVRELRCLVCKSSLQELRKKIAKIDPEKTIDIGGYRLDADGNYKQETVSQAKSETFLSELVDDVCNTMDDYIRATWKSNGTLMIMKIMTDEGGMNPHMSDVDIIQDEDLNKSLKYYCEGIMEEFEDNIIKHVVNESPNIEEQVCLIEASICLPISDAEDDVDELEDSVKEEL